MEAPRLGYKDGMKKALTLAVLASTLLSSVYAAPLVIYGSDDRHEVYEATAANQLLAKSTAIMILKSDIKPNGKPGLVNLSQKSLRQSFEGAWDLDVDLDALHLTPQLRAKAENMTLCEGTKFAEQPNPGYCSGFLIAPDLLVTAGHCVNLENFCDEYQWVFDFNLDKNSQSAGIGVKQDNVYKCQKVVSSHFEGEEGTKDYGVVKLDRPVLDRKALKFNPGQLSPKTTKVMVIGGPNGLPTKVAPNGTVYKNTHPDFFVTNLDTFEANSGSAVFDQSTGVVEGILVRGAVDYITDFKRMCIKANTCARVMDEDEDPSRECRGEEVSRLSSIPEVANQKALNEAAASGDVAKLENILSTPSWVDFYSEDGQSALIKAADAAQTASLKILLAKGADVNLADAKGNTALHALGAKLDKSNAEALTTLVNAGANLEAKNGLGQTALLAAGSILNLNGVKLLIKSGADKNAVDAKGENVLFSFMRAGNEKAVIELSALGVDSKPAMAVASIKQKIRLKLIRLVKN